MQLGRLHAARTQEVLPELGVVLRARQVQELLVEGRDDHRGHFRAFGVRSRTGFFIDIEALDVAQCRRYEAAHLLRDPAVDRVQALLYADGVFGLRSLRVGLRAPRRGSPEQQRERERKQPQI
jgi:hypothetical protein